MDRGAVDRAARGVEEGGEVKFRVPPIMRLYGNSYVPWRFDVNDEKPPDHKEYYKQCERERIAFEQRQRANKAQCQCDECKQERGY